MATNTNTTTSTELATQDTAELALTNTLEHLKEAFDKAHADFDAAEGARAVAAHNKAVAAVWMSRIAYRTMTHPDVATKRYPENITGAAKVLGMPVGTLRPYGLAGIALAKKDMAGLLSVPEQDDIALVEASFDSTSRADQKAKRVKEAAKKAALEAKAKELDALKANGSTAPATAPAPATGTDAPAPATGAATDQQAPATAPATGDGTPAQRGPSLEDDAVATARQLVAQIKKLRADKGWASVASKVVAILAEAFPVLKK